MEDKETLVEMIERCVSADKQELTTRLRRKLAGCSKCRDPAEYYQSTIYQDTQLTAIHAAADSGSLEVFKLILKKCQVIEDKPFLKSGREIGGILSFATSNIEIVKCALAKIRNLKFVERSDSPTDAFLPSPGEACVRAAIQLDRTDVIDALFEKAGDDIDALISLVAAVELNKSKVFSHLLTKAGKEINDEVQMDNNKGTTLLHFIVSQRRQKMLRLLLEQKECNVNVQLGRSGLTPLMHALNLALGNCAGHEIISELLTCRKLDLDVTTLTAPPHIINTAAESREWKALDYTSDKHCAHVKKQMDQARLRYEYQKKLQKKQNKAEFNDFNCSQEKTANGGKTKTCWSCKAAKENLMLCKGCKVALYCGETCQVMDWPKHANKCCKLREERKERKRKEKISKKASVQEKINSVSNLSNLMYEID